MKRCCPPSPAASNSQRVSWPFRSASSIAALTFVNCFTNAERGSSYQAPLAAALGPAVPALGSLSVVPCAPLVGHASSAVLATCIDHRPPHRSRKPETVSNTGRHRQTCGAVNALEDQGFTALTFRRRGAYFHRKVAGGASLGAAWPSDRSVLAHAHAARKILADPMGHERTGEAHH